MGFLLVTVMLLALADSPVFGGNGEDGLEKADQARQKHTDSLLGIGGVVGVPLGFNQAGKRSVVVFTESAGVAGVPNDVDGVPVHRRVSGKIVALKHECGHKSKPCGHDTPEPESGCTSPTARARPACTGISTGHPDVTAGTIGARVTDGTDVYTLSNNHVYANENQANMGDVVIQPGSFDGGNAPADEIGTLSNFEPIIFGGAPNTVDAAIALSSGSNLGKSTPSGGYGTPKAVTQPTSINLSVKRYGRTTAQTKGRITAINATINVGYDSGVATFTGQIIIEPGEFSAGGDSGSLIVVDAKGKSTGDDRNAVGLLFAVSPFFTVGNPIDLVLDRFEVTIDGD